MPLSYYFFQHKSGSLSEAPESSLVAAAGVREEPVLSLLASRFVHNEVLSRMTAREIATVAWAWARLDLNDRELMTALAEQMMETGPEPAR